jgi:hypothetical protein
MVPLNDWLRLPGVNVERYVDQGEHIVLQVTQSNPSIFCPSCGQFLERINQIRTCLIRVFLSLDEGYTYKYRGDSFTV